MTREGTRRSIVEAGIITVVRTSSSSDATRAAEAVRAGGISIVEITMTVPGAIGVIAELVKKMGADMLVGAGTVLDAETAQKCVDAGAEFLVSPAFDAETVRLASRLQKVMMAGALTPNEVLAAWKSGCDFVKIFPCGSVGGAKHIKALKGPFPEIPMIPTGGVNAGTAADFIYAGAEALGVGSELVSPEPLKTGNTSAITNLARRYVAIVREARQAMLQNSKP